MEEKIVIISPFTPKNNLVAASGGGMSYNTYNTIQGFLSFDNNQQVMLLAEKDNRFSNYIAEGNLTIIRCWERDKIKLWFQLIKQLISLRKGFKFKLLVQFEFAAYGDFFSTSFFPLFLFSLKLLGIKPNVVLHQVLLNLQDLRLHLGINNRFKLTIFTILISFFYILVTNLSGKVIVFEEILKLRLKKITLSKKKLVTIPHGLIIADNFLIKRDELKKKYGYSKDDFIVLLLGYLTWYKGSDWLVEAVKYFNKKNDKKIKLILAGGESSTQKNKKHYQIYYKNLLKSIEGEEYIHLTGYLPDEVLPEYVNLADLLVFPYRVLMSSSGPLSWALAYGRPYMISDNLQDYLLTEDAQDGNGFIRDLIIFKMDYEFFEEKIRNLMSNPLYLKQLSEYSRSLGEKRDWKKTAKNYIKIMV